MEGNSSMRDSTWKKKQLVLRERSALNITTDYLDLEEWNESSIKKRSSDLFEIALQIWRI
mgnify:FL=1